jgi:hypothetical protein
MAAQANLTLNTKVYTPRGKQGDVASWALVGDATFGGGRSNVTESVRLDRKSGIERIQFILAAPKLATADSACGCIGSETGVGKANIVIEIPSTFTAAERVDFRTRLQNLVSNAVFSAAVDTGEGAW